MFFEHCLNDVFYWLFVLVFVFWCSLTGGICWLHCELLLCGPSAGSNITNWPKEPDKCPGIKPECMFSDRDLLLVILMAFCLQVSELLGYLY